ncbi:MAG: DUF2220 family protein [Cellvibrionaceae bacterium]|nr:DUF2220 family protein [Cellvibrionaceae bacterium]
MSPPRWLAEEAWLQQLLHWFLDRCDKPRQQAITRRIGPKTVAALYRFNEDTDYRWQLLQQLGSAPYPIFAISPAPNLSPGQVPYERAQLRLLADAEPLLRQWLQRPRQDPLLLAWQQALAQCDCRCDFVDAGQSLLHKPLTLATKSPSQILAGFCQLRHYLSRGDSLGQGYSLREISARCFWGDSKFLDQRQELLQQLFGDLSKQLSPRPLLLSAYAPAGFNKLLFVENQDTFLRLADAGPAHYAIIYSAGFRASSQRLGQASTRFAFLAGSDEDYFEQHWQDPDMASYFWGDLDYAGLGILKALIQARPNTQAWQPGYQPMLQQLQAGAGHCHQLANKQNQIDPGQCGCDYADQVLLPALRSSGHFVDQEAVTPLP